MSHHQVRETETIAIHPMTRRLLWTQSIFNLLRLHRHLTSNLRNPHSPESGLALLDPRQLDCHSSKHTAAPSARLRSLHHPHTPPTTPSSPTATVSVVTTTTHTGTPSRNNATLSSQIVPLLRLEHHQVHRAFRLTSAARRMSMGSVSATVATTSSSSSSDKKNKTRQHATLSTATLSLMNRSWTLTLIKTRCHMKSYTASPLRKHLRRPLPLD